MIWFFERERDRLHFEIRHRTDGEEYELVVTYPDGSQFIERFADASGLIERSSSLRSELFERGWRALGDSIRSLSAASLH